MKRISARLTVVVALIVAAGAQVVTQLATAAPAAAIPGMVTNIAWTSTTTDPVKRAVADCPAGDAAISGGGIIYDLGANQVHLTESMPVAPYASDIATRWAATGAAPPGFTGKWYLTAYVICAPPPPTYVIIQNFAPNGPNSYKEAYDECAGTGAGRTILGAGFVVFSGDSSIPRNVGVSSMLLDGPTRVYVDAHTQQNGGGNAGNWQLDVSIICAELPGQTIADVQLSGVGGLVWCPSGTKVHGVFGGILQDSGDAFLAAIRPGNLALEDGVTYMTQPPSAGNTEVQAMCAP